MTLSGADIGPVMNEGISSDIHAKFKGEVPTKRNWLVENLAKVGLFRGGGTAVSPNLASHPGDSGLDEKLPASSGKPILIHAHTFSVERRDVSEAAMVRRAENRAIEEEKNDTIVTLFIRVHHRVEFGQKVFLVGSVHELGQWDPQKGVALAWSAGDMWSGRVDIRKSELAKLEYKYVVSGDVFTWEKCKNRYILKAPTREMVVTDRWEFPGFTHCI